MQTFFKTLVILMLAVALSLGLYILVDSQFSMSFASGGISPGFSWLLKMRADENGGQIAPSFEEMQASGSLPPFMQGGSGTGLNPGFPGGPTSGRQPAALSQGFDPQKAGGTALKDLGRLALAALIAAVLEVPLFWFFGRKRTTTAG